MIPDFGATNEFHDNEALQARIEYFAGKANEGDLTSDERAEYEAIAEAKCLIVKLEKKLGD